MQLDIWPKHDLTRDMRSASGPGTQMPYNKTQYMIVVKIKNLHMKRREKAQTYHLSVFSCRHTHTYAFVYVCARMSVAFKNLVYASPFFQANKHAP